MKRFTLFALLFFAFTAHSQNYALDPSFGTSGVSVKGFTFYPKDVMLYDNSYYFISNSYANGQVFKAHYNGSTDTAFGTDGLVNLNNSNNNTTHSISGFKIIDGYIYVYGTTNANTDIQQDAFIAKIDAATGAFDTTFGTNGISNINFAANAALNDFIAESNGGFYCIGTRSGILTYFKLNSNGTLNTAFDAAGYKQIVLSTSSYGNSIKAYDGNFLLIGTDYSYTNSTINQPLLLALVDASGNLVSSYGTGGTKTIELYGGMANTILKAELSANTLYADYFYAWSFSTQGGRTIKYNLGTDEKIYDNLTYYNSFSKPDGDKVYTTGFYMCSPSTSSSCPSDFELQRLNADGTPDTTFATSGTYTYNFPEPSFPWSFDRSATFLKADDGKILIAGSNSGNFAMIRIGDAALAVNEFAYKNNISPNPFTDQITISTTQQPLSAEVYDLTGRLVAKPAINYTDSNANLNLANITQSGMYLLKLSFGDRVVTQKIIKE